MVAGQAGDTCVQIAVPYRVYREDVEPMTLTEHHFEGIVAVREG
jgi:hypothetical protein